MEFKPRNLSLISDLFRQTTGFFLKKSTAQAVNAWLKEKVDERVGEIDFIFQSVADVFDLKTPSLMSEKKEFLRLFMRRVEFHEKALNTSSAKKQEGTTQKELRAFVAMSMLFYCCYFFMKSTFFSEESLKFTQEKTQMRRSDIENGTNDHEKKYYFLTLGRMYTGLGKKAQALECFEKVFALGDWVGLSESVDLVLKNIEEREGFDGSLESLTEEERKELAGLRKKIILNWFGILERLISNDVRPEELKNFSRIFEGFAKIGLLTQEEDVFVLLKTQKLLNLSLMKVKAIRDIRQGRSIGDIAKEWMPFVKNEEVGPEVRYFLGIFYLSENPRLAKAYLSYSREEETYDSWEIRKDFLTKEILKALKIEEVSRAPQRMSFQEMFEKLERKIVPDGKEFDFLATFLYWLDQNPNQWLKFRDKASFLSFLCERVAVKEDVEKVLPVLAGLPLRLSKKIVEILEANFLKKLHESREKTVFLLKNIMDFMKISQSDDWIKVLAGEQLSFQKMSSEELARFYYSLGYIKEKKQKDIQKIVAGLHQEIIARKESFKTQASDEVFLKRKKVRMQNQIACAHAVFRTEESAGPIESILKEWADQD